MNRIKLARARIMGAFSALSSSPAHGERITQARQQYAAAYASLGISLPAACATEPTQAPTPEPAPVQAPARPASRAPSSLGISKNQANDEADSIAA